MFNPSNRGMEREVAGVQTILRARAIMRLRLIVLMSVTLTFLAIVLLLLPSVFLIFVWHSLSNEDSIAWNALPSIGLILLGFIPLWWIGLKAIAVLFRRNQLDRPGIFLQRYHADHLWKTIGDLCRAFRVESCPKVFFQVEPSVSAYWGTLNNMWDASVSGNILIVGVPVLRALSIDELHSVLAHEIAHFGTADTAYRAWLAPFGDGLRRIQEQLRERLVRNAYRPEAWVKRSALVLPYVFIRFYADLFRGIEHSFAERLEIRADDAAAALTGAGNLRSALLKEQELAWTLRELVEAKNRAKGPEVTVLPSSVAELVSLCHLSPEARVTSAVGLACENRITPALAKRIDRLDEDDIFRGSPSSLALFPEQEIYERALNDLLARLQFRATTRSRESTEPLKLKYIQEAHLVGRTVAGLIDLVIVSILASGVTEFSIYTSQSRETQSFESWYGLFFTFVALSYFGLLEASAWRATPGKKLIGLRVCGRRGDTLGMFRAMLRSVYKWAFIVPSLMKLSITGGPFFHDSWCYSRVGTCTEVPKGDPESLVHRAAKVGTMLFVLMIPIVFMSLSVRHDELVQREFIRESIETLNHR
jgi:uncharacterized RDD family membrane protein YckC/Zn-dependent protease with chaperone function